MVAAPIHNAERAAPTTTTRLANQQMIERALRLICAPGSPFEIRTYKKPLSGIFTDPAAAAQLIARGIGRDQALQAIAVTLNPLKPEALYRQQAGRIQRADVTTGDSDIARRRLLLVDIDSKRLPGISATDEEHQAALDCARAIRAALTAEGWPEPLMVDSGNGAHLLYQIDLANDDGATQLVKGVLEALAARWNDAQVEIDQACANAARLTKIPGTIARKGSDTPERPHRMATIMSAPERPEPVPITLLEALAAQAPSHQRQARHARQAPTDRASHSQGNAAGAIHIADLRAWLDAQGVAYRERPCSPGESARVELEDCPFADHGMKWKAWAIQDAAGAIHAGCQAAKCVGRGFADMRDRLEPGWRARQQQRQQQSQATPDEDASSSEDSAKSNTNSNANSGNSARDKKEWEAPIPLATTLPPVAQLDMNMLPAKLRGFVWDIAERQQSPVDYAAVSVLVAAGAVVGRRIGIHPKRFDDWTVTPTPWGALVGPSGWGKTPSMKAATKPIERLIAQASDKLIEERQRYEAEKIAFEASKAALVSELKEAARLKDKQNAAKQVQQLKDELAALRLPPEPTARRFRTNDTTVEKLAELLIANPSGLLIFRDELMGWLRTLEKQGHESDRAFYNETWGGTTTNYEVDRIGRGSVIVPALCASVLGGIQPGPLRGYVYGASDSASVEADGFLQRFQLLVWPDAHTAFRVVDRWPAKEARESAYTVFDHLAQLAPAAYGATCADASDLTAIPTLRFSGDAQQVFYEWWTALETRVRSGELSDAFTSHLAKYRSLMPALALLFHLIDCDPLDPEQAETVGAVGVDEALQAIAWCEYLETHARRVYACAASPSIERANALLKRIKRGDVRDKASVRDIYIHGWERLQTIEEAEDALQTLEPYGWIRVEKQPAGPQGGRPTKIVHIHPTLIEGLEQEVEDGNV